MVVELNLSPKEEAQFATWAARQGESFEQEALALYRTRSAGDTLAMLFLKAYALLCRITDSERALSGGTYLLLLLQTIVALHHANGGRPYTSAELNRRTLLEEAMNLYDLEVVSLEVAARIAGISQREFLDALGRAGISALQYSIEEAFTEAQAV
jgi:predicted HTH domain antitoxin